MTVINNMQPPDDRAKQDERKQLKLHQVYSATPQQIENYIDNNVTDLASAKEALKLLAKLVLLKP